MNLHLPGPRSWTRDAHVSRENLAARPPAPGKPFPCRAFGKEARVQNIICPAPRPQAGEEQAEYTPGGFCFASIFEGSGCSSCNLFSAWIYLFSCSILIIYFLFELAKNCLSLGALGLLNRTHLGISRKNVPSNREKRRDFLPVFTLVFKFVLKLGQPFKSETFLFPPSLPLFGKHILLIHTFKSKFEFARILEQLFFSAYYEPRILFLICSVILEYLYFKVTINITVNGIFRSLGFLLK